MTTAGHFKKSHTRVMRRVTPMEGAKGQMKEDLEIPSWSDPSVVSLWFGPSTADTPKNQPEFLRPEIKCPIELQEPKGKPRSMTNLPVEDLKKRLEEAVITKVRVDDDQLYSVKTCRERNRFYDVTEVRSFMSTKKKNVSKPEMGTNRTKERSRKKFYDVEDVRRYIKRQQQKRVNQQTVTLESSFRVCSIRDSYSFQKQQCQDGKASSIQCPNREVKSKPKSLMTSSKNQSEMVHFSRTERMELKENVPFNTKRRSTRKGKSAVFDDCAEELDTFLKELLSNFKKCESILLRRTIPKMLAMEQHSKTSSAEKGTQTSCPTNSFVDFPNTSIAIVNDKLHETLTSINTERNSPEDTLHCLTCENISFGLTNLSEPNSFNYSKSKSTSREGGTAYDYHSEAKKNVEDQLSQITWQTLHTMIFEDDPLKNAEILSEPLDEICTQDMDKVKSSLPSDTRQKNTPITLVPPEKLDDEPDHRSKSSVKTSSLDLKVGLDSSLESANDLELPSLLETLPSCTLSSSVTQRVNEIRRKRNLNKSITTPSSETTFTVSSSAPKDLMRLTPVIDFEDDFDLNTSNDISDCLSFSSKENSLCDFDPDDESIPSLSFSSASVSEKISDISASDKVCTRMIVETIEDIAKCVCKNRKSGCDWHWTIVEKFSDLKPNIKAYKLFLCDLCKFIIENELRDPLEKPNNTKSLHEIVKLLRKPLMTYEPKSLCNILKTKVLSLINEFGSNQNPVMPNINRDGLVGFWKKKRKRDIVDTILIKELRLESF